MTILITGHEKDRFTGMLVCRGDGSKLPLCVLFKRNSPPKNTKFWKGVLFRCQGKGSVEKGLVQDWLEKSWWCD